LVKFQKRTEDADNGLDERIREKDLKGHIKPSTTDGSKVDEPAAKDQKNSSELSQDNQLKTAIDILKSWDIMKKNLSR
jgi:carboxyl-terminal processing protease